uniref:7TM_GPCR_Srx domain-containing protein n=1 Tax=Meloidogyne hapla TaxID=6305 RepID=A0A1I8AXX4_MELHA
MTVFAYKKRLKKNVGVNLTANGNKYKEKIERNLCLFALFTSFGQMSIASVVRYSFGHCFYAIISWQYLRSCHGHWNFSYAKLAVTLGQSII